MHNIFHYSRKTLILLLILVSVSCQKDKIVDLSQRDNLEKVIESEFNRLQMPGLAYAAVKDDSVVYICSKGYANKFEKIPFTPQTRIIIASISKTMVVTAIMQLYEKGLIFLDDDINKYLPLTVRNPKYPDDKITVEMLLTHTSSISDDGYDISFFYLYGYVDYPESLLSFEKNYLTKEGQYYTKSSFSKYKPGTTYSYSNLGASLLACLVETISGTDYNTYCKTNIFQPLGMTRTTWFFSETPRDEIAIPYDRNNGVNPSKPFFSYPSYPDGHLITTIEDLSKFLRAYIMDGTFNHYQLLKPETVEIILREHTRDNNEIQGLIFYEYKIGNFTVWGHDGADPGVATEMYFDRENHTGFIQFTNRNNIYPNPETLGNALLLYANQQQ
jgi:CubicO group peptidase (beta-lactamase class C family)